MVLSKSIEEAIENKDLSRIYSSFYTILLSDPGFSKGKFMQVFDEVKSRNIEGFIQKYDGKPFKTTSEWNQQYWDVVASELMDNFCIERIEHLKAVGKYLYPTISDEKTPEKKVDSRQGTEKKTKPVQNLKKEENIDTGKIIVIVTIIIIILIIIIGLSR